MFLQEQIKSIIIRVSTKILKGAVEFAAYMVQNRFRFSKRSVLTKLALGALW